MWGNWKSFEFLQLSDIREVMQSLIRNHGSKFSTSKIFQLHNIFPASGLKLLENGIRSKVTNWNHVLEIHHLKLIQVRQSEHVKSSHLNPLYFFLSPNKYTFSFIWDSLSPHYSNFQPKQFFPNFFPDDRRITAEPWLAKDGRHGIAISKDGYSGTIMTIDELHVNFNTSS